MRTTRLHVINMGLVLPCMTARRVLQHVLLMYRGRSGVPTWQGPCPRACHLRRAPEELHCGNAPVGRLRRCRPYQPLPGLGCTMHPKVSTCFLIYRLSHVRVFLRFRFRDGGYMCERGCLRRNSRLSACAGAHLKCLSSAMSLSSRVPFAFERSACAMLSEVECGAAPIENLSREWFERFLIRADTSCLSNLGSNASQLLAPLAPLAPHAPLAPLSPHVTSLAHSPLSRTSSSRCGTVMLRNLEARSKPACRMIEQCKRISEARCREECRQKKTLSSARSLAIHAECLGHCGKILCLRQCNSHNRPGCA